LSTLVHPQQQRALRYGFDKDACLLTPERSISLGLPLLGAVMGQKASRIAACSREAEGHLLRLFDAQSGDALGVFGPFAGSLRALCLDPSERTMAAAFGPAFVAYDAGLGDGSTNECQTSARSGVFFFELETRRHLCFYPHRCLPRPALAIRAEQAFLALDNELLVLDLHTAEPVWRLSGERGSYAHVCLDETAERMVVGSRQGVLSLFRRDGDGWQLEGAFDDPESGADAIDKLHLSPEELRVQRRDRLQRWSLQGSQPSLLDEIDLRWASGTNDSLDFAFCERLDGELWLCRLISDDEVEAEPQESQQASYIFNPYHESDEHRERRERRGLSDAEERLLGAYAEQSPAHAAMVQLLHALLESPSHQLLARDTLPAVADAFGRRAMLYPTEAEALLFAGLETNSTETLWVALRVTMQLAQRHLLSAELPRALGEALSDADVDAELTRLGAQVLWLLVRGSRPQSSHARSTLHPSSTRPSTTPALLALYQRWLGSSDERTAWYASMCIAHVRQREHGERLPSEHFRASVLSDEELGIRTPSPERRSETVSCAQHPSRAALESASLPASARRCMVCGSDDTVTVNHERWGYTGGRCELEELRCQSCRLYSTYEFED
jgi:hypothetical protein